MATVKNVDQYLAQYEGSFAHPILELFRRRAHEAVPELEEKIKWGAPSFEYKGRMFGIAAFKRFVSIWFDKGVLLRDPAGLLEASSSQTKAMRKYSVATVEEVERAALIDLMQQAAQLNAAGREVAGLNKPREAPKNSAVLEALLAENDQARKGFESLTPGRQREYLIHIESAAQEATKRRRAQKALPLLVQRVGLNDRYKK